MFAKEFYDAWETLVEFGVATDEEIGLVTALLGGNIGTLRKILYVRTGYNDFSTFVSEETD